MDDYTAKTWFQLKCSDPDEGPLWNKARILCTFKRGAITCLYLFQRRIENLEQENSRTSSQRSLWCNEVHDNIRILLDRIVTRWIPYYLLQRFGINSALDNSLTPEPLLTVSSIFGDPQDESGFDVEHAQELYEQCFIPLLYHELWENIKHDAKSIISNNFSNANDNITIEIKKNEPQVAQPAHRSESPIPTTLIFGSYSFDIDRSFTRTFPKLGLGDIILISIKTQGQTQRFFAVVVHVNDRWPANMDTIPVTDLVEGMDNKNIINVNSRIVLYTSKKCSDVIEKHCTSVRSNTISVAKLSNFTSSRRHISAVYNLRKFSKQRTLVRVGREAPLDHDVCEHFLESQTMQQLVRMMQSREPVIETTVGSVKEGILTKAKVIISTLNYSANSTLLLMKHRKDVDLVIIDEACQSLEPDCLLPFYFGCAKIILVGDPQQLPPCVLSPAGQGHNLSQSLYDRLNDIVPPKNISMLTEQYRMHQEICDFPNKHFYDGQLITHESVMNYWTAYPSKPYYLYNLTYTTHQCPPNGRSSDNKEERIFIKKFCIKLLERLVGRQPYLPNDPEFIEMEKRIVVITPYKGQMKKFRKQSLQFPRHIEVLTVDSAQGKEKDIVLISCVRSGEGKTIGFLNDKRRLNVMLTRARRALYIFGNLDWLAERDPHWDELFDNAVARQVIDTVSSSDHQINLPLRDD
ncbi:unnamed protein product [Adineta steineri]|uniref:Uncharacterized protein n=1 Tax=Adineta steineri TaxID=433720 RepID=A0A815B1D6_9BILA|nr:unnamed protein product [Adineta steineri]